MADTPRGYPLIPAGVAPDVPYWHQQLAEAIDDDLTAALAPLAARKVAFAKTAVTAADGTFTIAIPAGTFAAAPIAAATVVTTTQMTVVRIESATATSITGRVHYWAAGAWTVTSGFVVNVHAVQA